MSNNKRLDGVFNEFYDTHLAGGKPRYRSSPAKTRKQAVYNMYWRVLTELSLNRFKWYGLPSSVDERFLELSLMRHGKVLFFKYQDPLERFDPRYLVQQFTSVGELNHYDNPTVFQVQSTGGIHGTYTGKQAVPIWGNYLRYPDMDIINVYADRLTEIDTTIDVNTTNMRHPRVLVMSEHSKLTMENIDRQKQEGIPTIKVAPGVAGEDMYATLDMGTHHETMPGLLAAKGKMWNDALMMLGVPTVNQDKKERMITGEAETGKDQSEVIRNIALNSRKQGAQQINELFGVVDDLAVGVEWRAHDEMQQMVDMMTNMMGVEDTGYDVGEQDTPPAGVQLTPNQDSDDDDEDEDEGEQ